MIKKLLEWGFKHNVWVWFHMGAGAIGAKIFIQYLDKQESLLILLVLASVWEVIEFVWDGGIKGMIKIYGSVERWLYDAAGDIIGAMLMGLIIVT
jgi:hypothetical protein